MLCINSALDKKRHITRERPEGCVFFVLQVRALAVLLISFQENARGMEI